MDQDQMSGREMAILAAQARANIRRLLDFASYQPEDEACFARVDSLLKGIVDDV